MARAGRVVAESLALLGESMSPGMTTQDLDEIAEEHIRAQGGVPTFKGYRGFPASICTSPNSMVVHGIPGRTGSTRATCSRSTSASPSTASSPTRAYTFAVGEIDPRARSACSRSARRRSTPGSSRRARATGRRHLGGRPADDRGGRLLGRQDARRARRRALDARGAADPELRRAGPWPASRSRDDARDRADDQRGRTRASSPADDRWSISTATARSSAHFEHTVAVTDERAAHPHAAGVRV